MKKKKEYFFETECVAMSQKAASFHIDVLCGGANFGSVNVIVNNKGENSIDMSKLNKMYVDVDTEDYEFIKSEAIKISLDRARVIFN